MRPRMRWWMVGCLVAALPAMTACIVIPIGTATSAAPASPFKAEYDANLTEPEIVVDNQTDRLLTLSLQGPAETTLSVPPQEKKKVTLAAGEYEFFCSAPGVQSLSGSQVFQKKYRYVWQFSIMTIRR